MSILEPRAAGSTAEMKCRRLRGEKSGQIKRSRDVCVNLLSLTRWRTYFTFATTAAGKAGGSGGTLESRAQGGGDNCSPGGSHFLIRTCNHPLQGPSPLTSDTVVGVDPPIAGFV